MCYDAELANIAFNLQKWIKSNDISWKQNAHISKSNFE